jgi:G:T-mismatch repair DNA endonuclease (very short patch repair protein)
MSRKPRRKSTTEERIDFRIKRLINQGLIEFNDLRISEFKEITFLAIEKGLKDLVLHFIKHNVKTDLIKRCEQYSSLKKNKGTSKEKMFIMYEKEDATKKWENYIKLQAETNTFDYKNKKYGMTKEQFDDYNQNRSSTEENFIRRHGIKEGKEKWDVYKKRQSYAGCAEDYFIEKYGTDEGKQIFLDLNKKKARTLENYISKYGIKEGTIKYEFYISYIAKPFYSKLSQELCWDVYDKLPLDIKEKTYFGELNKEFGKMFEGCYVKYDFCISSLKYIMEFNGDYWHANPEVYEDDFSYSSKHISSRKTAKDIWEHDEKKISVIENEGFYVDIVWEKDYNESKSGTVLKIYNKIMEIYEKDNKRK